MILSQIKKEIAEKLNIEEARSIIEFVTGVSRDLQNLNGYYTLTNDEYIKIIEIIKKRESGYPLQYIIGKWSFMDNYYYVGEGVLIPRDDTEVLVRSVIPYLQNIDKPCVIDLCSGSGIIPITLKKLFPNAIVYALELSEKAIPYLEKNIQYNNSDVKLFKGDLNKLYSEFKDCYFDLIISNPPYIKSEEMNTLQSEVKLEPHMALDGGIDGLDFYKVITEKWTPKIKPCGMLAYEIGENQFDEISILMKNQGYKNIKGYNDLGNTIRAISGTLGKK